MVLLTIIVLVALAGWIAGRDPGMLTGLIGTLGISQVGLEAGNVGKRATFKKEAVE